MIIAFAGLAGAGKTTAIGLLEDAGHGRRLYVGGFVTAEVARRGLEPSPDNERLVRNDLRESGGMGILAKTALTHIEIMHLEGDVLVDAVYNDEERAIYAGRFGDGFKVVGMRTPTSIRSARLEARNHRPLSLEQLESRDEYELRVLRLEDVLRGADHDIDNAGSLDQLENTLNAMLAKIG